MAQGLGACVVFQGTRAQIPAPTLSELQLQGLCHQLLASVGTETHMADTQTHV